jgi:hypothetical protein
MLVMAMAFIAYFAIGLATPVLPLHVHEALAAVSSLEASSPQRVRDQLALKD